MIYTNNGTSTTYYFQRNIQGDVVAIYDTNGNKVTEYAYDAFGNCTILSTTNSTIAHANPFRYRGYYLDAETGFYYLNARYYSPEWRRFISPDDTAYLDPETPNGLNLYCYCGNDPVNYADPSGHEPVAITVGFGLLLLYAVSLLSLTAIVAGSSNTNIKPSDVPNIFDIDAENAYGVIKDLIMLYAAGLAVKKWYDSEEKHHIVARIDLRATISRIILDFDDVSIDIEDERNKVSMKKGYHRVLHTNLYYTILNYSMIASYVVGGKEGVEWLLSTYQDVLGNLK